MKRWIVPVLAAGLLLCGGDALANRIRRVIPVNFITIEVVMKEPLTEAETDPFNWEKVNGFSFNENVHMTGAPMEVDVKGYPNTYHIPVDGLDIGYIYKISYRGQKAKTFSVKDERETEERYKNRYGDYF